uniref:HPP transmembrane region domain-containing protein n=1 Tax=Entomoneis paludosa TaxID=265537 RepID=A0A6U3CCM3_9STRA
MWHVTRKNTLDYLRKFKGGNGQVAPPLNAPQSGWTLLGSFSGLLLLSAYNEWIKNESDGDYELLMGPFGALMTLLYGLHSAPASQPRNVVLGQVVAGAVSLSFTYIPEDVMPVWIRRAVGPAFAIAAMVKLGVTHPPAGAHSVIYASGTYNWLFYFFVVLGAMISVAPAVLINNMSNRRQYPIYWGYWTEYLQQSWQKLSGQKGNDKSN